MEVCVCKNCDMPEVLVRRMFAGRMSFGIPTRKSPKLRNLKALNSLAARTAPPHIKIFQSHVPNAGLGAYLVRPVKKGQTLGEYKGHHYPCTAERWYDDYLFEVRNKKGRGKYMISTMQYNVWPYSWTRFINTVADWRDDAMNTEFFQSNNRIFVRALKDMPNASALNPVELMTYYGCDAQEYINGH